MVGGSLDPPIRRFGFIGGTGGEVGSRRKMGTRENPLEAPAAELVRKPVRKGLANGRLTRLLALWSSSGHLPTRAICALLTGARRNSHTRISVEHLQAAHFPTQPVLVVRA